MIKHVYLETYGCSANQNNSELIKARLFESGLDLVSNEELADLFIINTCIVKCPTENKILGRIRELENTGKPIIVTGCIVPVRFKELKDRKNIYLLSLNNLSDITKLIRRITDKTYTFTKFNSDSKEIKLGRKLRNNKLIGIVQISEGCLGNCSFCITRQAKGSLLSFPEEKVLEQVKKDLKDGCKEIWLTSQDNASYGLPEKTELPALLSKILDLPGKFRVRLGMMNPENVLPIIDDLINLYKNEKMYKFLHIPVQSGSDKVLATMNRRYKAEDFMFIINNFKKQIPETTIATDIIAAYPTESEEDFQATIETIKKAKPDVINISRFWPRRGTPSAQLKKLPDKIAMKRCGQLMLLHKSIALKNNLPLVGSIQQVLFTEVQGSLFFGRNQSYRTVIVKSPVSLLGKLAKIQIKEAKEHCLLGDVVD